MATLSDGKVTRAFPLPPENTTTQIQGDYATNAVLDVANPRVRRKSSARTLRLGRVLLVSYNLQDSQLEIINSLKFWALSQTRLRYVSNTDGLEICYIKSLSITVKQWRAGLPVHAEADIELMEASVVPEPKTATATKGAAKTKLTPRMQQKAKTKVDKALSKPSKKQKFGIKGSYKSSVSPNGVVTLVADGLTQEYLESAFG